MAGIDGCSTKDVDAVTDDGRVGQGCWGRAETGCRALAGEVLMCLFRVRDSSLGKGGYFGVGLGFARGAAPGGCCGG